MGVETDSRRGAPGFRRLNSLLLIARCLAPLQFFEADFVPPFQRWLECAPYTLVLSSIHTLQPLEGELDKRRGYYHRSLTSMKKSDSLMISCYLLTEPQQS